MKIKQDSFYDIYIFFLNDQLESGKINRGEFNLYSICENSFLDFKLTMVKNVKFKREILIKEILKKD